MATYIDIVAVCIFLYRAYSAVCVTVFLLHLHEELCVNRAPVVGWPPVRSFRKNTLQSAAGLGAGKGISTSADLCQHEDASKANESVTDQQIKGSTKETLFVKAKLDGVRICRKVDLTSYSSYDSLKSALQEMFQGFVCGGKNHSILSGLFEDESDHYFELHVHAILVLVTFA